jgi:hypothetical protein
MRDYSTQKEIGFLCFVTKCLHGSLVKSCVFFLVEFVHFLVCGWVTESPVIASTILSIYDAFLRKKRLQAGVRLDLSDDLGLTIDQDSSGLVAATIEECVFLHRGLVQEELPEIHANLTTSLTDMEKCSRHREFARSYFINQN